MVKKTIIYYIIFLMFFQLLQANESLTPYTVYIKPGAVITKIFDESKHTLPKGIYAKVIEKNSKLRDEFVIFDKKNNQRYLVDANDIVEVEDDLNLFPAEKGDIEFTKGSNFKVQDKKISLMNEFQVNYDQLNISNLNAFSDTNSKSILSPRYKFTALIQAPFDLHIGLNFNIQNSKWISDSGLDNNINIISLGPEIKYQILKDSGLNLFTHAGFEFAPYYRMRTNSDNLSFSSNIWSLGFTNEFNFLSSSFSIGFDFRKHDTTMQSNIVKDEISLQSYGITLGYIYHWSL